MKNAVQLKKPFGKATFSRVRNARYLGWEDAFDVEFEDGLCFLEPHGTIRKANRRSSANRRRLSSASTPSGLAMKSRAPISKA